MDAIKSKTNKKTNKKENWIYATILKDFWQFSCFVLHVILGIALKCQLCIFYIFPKTLEEQRGEGLQIISIIFTDYKNFTVWMICWDVRLDMWLTVTLSFVNESPLLPQIPLCGATFICPYFYPMKPFVFLKHEWKIYTISLFFSIELKLISILMSIELSTPRFSDSFE